MYPVVALVGRPNVGKSTLFNRLTRSRDAIVADVPGLTRDRRYGRAMIDHLPVILVDTGGIGEQSDEMDQLVSDQAAKAMDESDVLLFLVDAKQGLNAADESIAALLRKKGRPVILVANKVDGVRGETQGLEDFYRLGFEEPVATAAAHGRGISELKDRLLSLLPEPETEPEQEDERIRVSIVGKPNVGKSTLVNALLGEERVIVSDTPGTTRDSNMFDFEFRGRPYILVDTAGIRRRSKVTDVVEKFSVVKALQAIAYAHVVIYMLDGSETISDRDSSLLDYVTDNGKALVIAVNKSEKLGRAEKLQWEQELQRHCPFVHYARVLFISALKSQGLPLLWKSVEDAVKNAFSSFPTPELTELLNEAVEKHQPPLVQGRRIKLRYAHQGGKNPPLLVIHGNQTRSIPDHYRRYLVNFFYQALRLQGTPLRIQYKTGDNPFAGRKNKLTPRQERRRKRLIRHVKKRGG